jgi:hypothetical protein
LAKRKVSEVKVAKVKPRKVKFECVVTAVVEVYGGWKPSDEEEVYNDTPFTKVKDVLAFLNSAEGPLTVYDDYDMVQLKLGKFKEVK